jgi:hypothetical protein
MVPTGSRRTRRALVALPVTALVALAACTDDPVPSAPRATPPRTAVAAPATPELPRPRTLDDEYVALAREAPGFGGLFLDSAGIYHVFLTDVARAAAARPAIAAFLQERGVALASGGDELQVRQGRYDYGQLAEAFQRLTPALTAAGITQWDIDEARNRVTVGVIDSASATRVRADLARLDLPPGLVAIKLIPPTNVTGTLREAYSPRVGGLQIYNINWPNGSPGGPGTCTLGYNVRLYYTGAGTYDPAQYFTTASHCTRSMTSMTGDTVGQPDAAHRIGVEVAESPPVTSAEAYFCPVGAECRYSDAALFRYFPGVNNYWGRVARLSSFAQINGYFTNVKEWEYAAVGSVVGKMGRTTWFTEGRVISTCASVRQYVGGAPTNRIMLCQGQAEYGSDGGDSGAPVFTRAYSNYGIGPVGTHWGKGPSVYDDPTSTFRATYSRIGDVTYDLRRALTTTPSELRVWAQ